MVCNVLIAAVSCAYILARFSLGRAIVAMIRMMAITIISSISENPRRLRFWFIPAPALLFYDARGAGIVQADLYSVPDEGTLRGRGVRTFALTDPRRLI